MKKNTLPVALFLILLTLVTFGIFNTDEPLLFLTWENEDTSHTMTINYLSESKSQEATVYYDTVPRGGQPEDYSHQARGTTRSYPGITFAVHSIELVNLDPKENYYFIAGDEDTGYTHERKFRTIPLEGDIRFISGGDASVSPAFEKVSKIAAESNPHFAIIGGDIAYADGDINLQHIWLELLSIWNNTMVTPDGFTIPLIAAIGNHEINDTDYRPTKTLRDQAPFYFLIFHPAEDKTFFKRKLGNNSILFILDTDHIYSSDGEQLKWMKNSFSQHAKNNFRFASYHVPLYPSFRDPEADAHVLLRKNWLKTFDRYRLDVAFENHEHALKKSRLLKNNKVSETSGTYYLGDGDWGTDSFTPDNRWYLENFRAVNHVWSVTLNAQKASFKVLTVDGVDKSYSFDIPAKSHGVIN